MPSHRFQEASLSDYHKWYLIVVRLRLSLVISLSSCGPQRTASVWRRSRWRVKLRCNYPEATELLGFSSVSTLPAVGKSDKVNSDPLCNGQGYLGFVPRAPCSRRVRIQSFVPDGQVAFFSVR